MIGRAVEDALVQAGFAIALAQLAEQYLAGLGHQSWVGFDAPLRMARQLLRVELPQARRQSRPVRIGVAKDLGQEGRVDFFRACQHQVGLELRVGHTGTLAALGAVRRQFDQRVEARLQMGHRRIAQQALIGLDVTRPQRGQQRIVLTQPKALIPRRAVLGAVIQARQFADQFVEREELLISALRLFEGGQYGLHLRDLHAVADERQQQTGAPDHGQAQCQPISDARRAPAQAPAVRFRGVQHALPDRAHRPEVVIFAIRLTGQRQAEPQAAQRQVLPEDPEPRRQRLAPTGQAFDLQIPRQAQQEIMIRPRAHLRPAFVAQRFQQIFQRVFQDRRRQA
ncbi:hypothetical protein D3C73_964720 [compost metagenome]